MVSWEIWDHKRRGDLRFAVLMVVVWKETIKGLRVWNFDGCGVEGNKEFKVWGF